MEVMQRLFCGWLTKSPKADGTIAARLSRWRRRFFVLSFPAQQQQEDVPTKQYAMLEYYDSERCRSKKGAIDLEHCDEVLAYLESDQYKFIFALHTVDRDRNSERTYYLASETEDEMNKWVELICDKLGHQESLVSDGVTQTRLVPISPVIRSSSPGANIRRIVTGERPLTVYAECSNTCHSVSGPQLSVPQVECDDYSIFDYLPYQIKRNPDLTPQPNPWQMRLMSQIDAEKKSLMCQPDADKESQLNQQDADEKRQVCQPDTMEKTIARELALPGSNRVKPVISDTVPYAKLDIDAAPIGSGAFGAVYRAVHIDWGCLVAYKKLGTQFITEESHIKDLKNEADIHRQLRHPNIVSMLGVVFEDNNYGLILEYVCYRSLASFLDEIKKLSGARYTVSWQLKTRMIYEVCCGMSYLHSLEPVPVIHRDLKVQNVVVGEQLHVKISDFGLSKWKDYQRTHTHAGSLQGTPSHIPPEKWNDLDRREDEKFDVYSFGILQWEIFTEKRAFENCKTIIRTVVMDGIRPSLDKLQNNVLVPTAITAKITDCWQQEPVNRPTFTDLMFVFKQFTDGSEAQNEIERTVKDVLKVYHNHSDDTQSLSEHAHKLKNACQKLCANIRRANLILTMLVQTRSLTLQECDEIRSQSTVYNVVRHLINVLCSKPVTAYKCFLNALTATDQKHLYHLLEDGELNVEHKDLLIDNCMFIKTNLIISGTNLLDYLLQSHVLDEQEVEEIKSKTTEMNRVDQLLYFIMRTSQEQYQVFLKALAATNQQFVLDEFQQEAHAQVLTFATDL